MAKKVSRPATPVEVTPGANPYAKSVTSGKRFGTVLGAICMIMFIVFDELWIGTAAGAVCLAILFVLQVFEEKSRVWYKSVYLYTFFLAVLLAWMEYSGGLVTDFMKIG